MDRAPRRTERGRAPPVDRNSDAEVYRYAVQLAQHWSRTHAFLIDTDEARSIAGEVVATQLPRWRADGGRSVRNFVVMRVEWAMVDAVRKKHGRYEHQHRDFEPIADLDWSAEDEDASDPHSFLESLPPTYRLIVEGLVAGATRAELAERLGTNVATTRRMIAHIRDLYEAWG
jgi:hypothetical protein